MLLSRGMCEIPFLHSEREHLPLSAARARRVERAIYRRWSLQASTATKASRAVIEWQRWPCGGLGRPSEPHAAAGRRGVMHRPRACSFSAPGKRNGRPSLEAWGGRKSALKGRGLRRPRPRKTVRPARAGINPGLARSWRRWLLLKPTHQGNHKAERHPRHDDGNNPDCCIRHVDHADKCSLDAGGGRCFFLRRTYRLRFLAIRQLGSRGAHSAWSQQWHPMTERKTRR
jgi:hypothetical protein